jgi:hypothetical protein
MHFLGTTRLRSPIGLTLIAIVAFLVAVAGLGHAGASPDPSAGAPPLISPVTSPTTQVAAPSPTDPPPSAPYVVLAGAPIAPKPQLPGGGYRIFGHHRFLVAYYGTPQAASMGVLGQSPPDTMARRVVRAGRPFLEKGDQLQPVYELIVTVADASPGSDGDYSHDIPASLVQDYIDLAHRHHALLLLDLQTGRSSFPTVAKRWAWALKDPSVGLALDPEWRMGPHQVPAHVIGSVRAAEVNRTSAWLSRMVARHQLPEKLFVLHQFRLSMLPDIGRIVHRPGLAMVQHADGFGTRGQKLATYHAIARPKQFTQGFKLFYKVDINRFTAPLVRDIRPAVRFVSFQ